MAHFKQMAGELMQSTTFADAVEVAIEVNPDLVGEHPPLTEGFTEPELEVMRSGGLLRDGPGSTPSAAEQTIAEAALLFNRALTVSEAARRLKVVESRVRQRLNDRSLFGVKVDGEWRLPEFQFGVASESKGLSRVLQAIPADLHVVELWRWLSTEDPDLELKGEAVSPMYWLATGGPPGPVVAIARTLSEGL